MRATKTISNQRHWVLVGMLALLHGVLLVGAGSVLGRALLLAHLGLFLIWQPFMRAEARLGNPQLLAVVAVVVAGLVWLSWWMMGIWLILLAGLVGGRVFFFHQLWRKRFFSLALVYLILALLLLAIPHAFPRTIVIDPVVYSLARYGLPFLLLCMTVLPVGGKWDEEPEAIDLAYSLLMILLLAVLVLGSAALMLLQGISYLPALLMTLFAMASMLVLFGWMWNPRAGFGGLGTMVSRYMLSIGNPFEHWLHAVADLAQGEPDPYRFLRAACRDMVRQIPWARGGGWHLAGQTGDFGEAGGLETVFATEDLTLVLRTQQVLPPALVWHMNLVTQLLAEFCRSKLQDQALREMTYMRAVHDTGAMLTHDIKNLLQILNGLIFAVRQEGENEALLHRLLQHQLPQIGQRLQQTLEKLGGISAPVTSLVPVGVWWQSLPARYEGQDIEFHLVGVLQEREIPDALFTSAVENFVQNALGKRTLATSVRIDVILDCTAERPFLRVIDTGAAMADYLAEDIGRRPVTSAGGLGIGLYQLARAARLAGYRVHLLENRPGRVSLGLLPAEQMPGPSFSESGPASTATQ
ncbi:MAG: sensor histidine kinase [Proteobacteria bacterium]|nr:sensor histidine kinase [Pseudomonadota bacterium]HQR03746.1 hypothetical protein [Rhodocyclaceae bacterium]